MPDDQIDDGAMLGAQIDSLSHEIRQLPASSPEAALEHICLRLSLITPLSSAGVFRLDKASNALEWMQQPTQSLDFMNTSLQRDHAGLSDLLTTGSQRPFNGSGENQTSGYVFIGLSAGNYNGAPIGLGLASSRSLKESELSRLGGFGLLIGLLAENTRLTQMITEKVEGNSTARLIGFIAHELRTPLTGMRGNIQLALMANRKGQHDRIPTRLEAAIEGVDDMSNLVQQLLDVSRLERGDFPISFADARVGHVVRQAIESLQMEVGRESAARVTLLADVDSTILIDQNALQKTICLLLKTAIQYSSESGGVQSTIRDASGYAVVDITYSGSPFSGDDVAALSAPLSSAQPSGERSDNLSLDLAFCRGVIQQHNGRIALYADKPAPGQQTIELSIPRLLA